MRGKLLMVVGVAVGYVLGAKAGRSRYDDIKRAAGTLWSSRLVQHRVGKVEDYARAKAPDVLDFLSDGAKRLVSKAGRTAAAKRDSAKRDSAKRDSASGTTPTTAAETK